MHGKWLELIGFLMPRTERDIGRRESSREVAARCRRREEQRLTHT
jgi:hypothetical protein